jgi:hypothetical protein
LCLFAPPPTHRTEGLRPRAKPAPPRGADTNFLPVAARPAVGTAPETGVPIALESMLSRAVKRTDGRLIFQASLPTRKVAMQNIGEYLSDAWSGTCSCALNQSFFTFPRELPLPSIERDSNCTAVFTELRHPLTPAFLPHRIVISTAAPPSSLVSFPSAFPCLFVPVVNPPPPERPSKHLLCRPTHCPLKTTAFDTSFV